MKINWSPSKVRCLNTEAEAEAARDDGHHLSSTGDCEACAGNLNQLNGESRKFLSYVDSGAIERVVPKHGLPEFKVKSPVGSRRGQQYVTANGARICNEDEQTVEALPGR